jgi:hypothetical protein
MVVDARVRNWAHNPKVVGSNPAPATNFEGRKPLISFELQVLKYLSFVIPFNFRVLTYIKLQMKVRWLIAGSD